MNYEPSQIALGPAGAKDRYSYAHCSTVNIFEFAEKAVYNLCKVLFHIGFIIVFILTPLYNVYVPNVSIKIELN